MKKSRRDFFIFISTIGLVSFFATPANAKTSKSIVKYQSTPKDGNACNTCMFFLPETNECQIVEGSIDPNGWCTSYFRDPNNKKVNSEDDNQTNSIDNTA